MKKASILFRIVGVSLVLDGLANIVFADWFRTARYSQGTLLSLVQIFIGGSLFLELSYSRFLGILYCLFSLLGTIDSFFSRHSDFAPYRMLNIYYFSYAFICAFVLALAKPRSEVPQVGDSSSKHVSSESFNRIPRLANRAYYLPLFEKFETGSSLLSWNWSAFFFSFFWQAFRGLWIKMLLYLGLFSLLGFWINIFRLPFLSGLFWFGVSIFYGLFSNYDYYLLKVRQEPLWPWLLYKRHKREVWAAVLVFFGLFVVSNIWYYTSGSLGWSYPYTIHSVGTREFQIGLGKRTLFRVSFPQGWGLNRFQLEKRWLSIKAPGIEGLGLGIYDLPEELQGKFDQAQLSILIQREIFANSWVSRGIFNPSDWICSPQEIIAGRKWAFCGYRSSPTSAISYHVVFTVLEKQLSVVAYPQPTPANKEAFRKNLGSFLSSIREEEEF